MQPFNSSFQSFNPMFYQQNTGIQTHIVDDFANIPASNVPMDNYGAYFVKRDGTEIQAKRWGTDGKINTIRYTQMPQEEILDEKTENVMLEKLNGLYARLDALEEVLAKPPTRRKKEVAENE